MSVVFNNQNLSDLDGVKVIGHTPARPPYRRNKAEIPGKPGSYDFGNNQPMDFEVIVSVVVLGDTIAELRNRVANLFSHLDGKSTLVVDNFSYEARVYESVDMEENRAGNMARGDIVFECDAV